MEQVRQSRILEVLRRERRPWTVGELEQATKVDIRNDRSLQDSLKRNPRIKITKEEGRVRVEYRPQAEGVTNAEELLRDFRRRCIDEYGRMGPVDRSIYSDAYTGVEKDIDEHVRQHRLISLANDDTKEVFLYHDEPSLHIALDDDIKTLAGCIKPPVELHEYLRANGLPVAGPSRAVPALVATSSKSLKRKRKPGTLKMATNTHMGAAWMHQTAHNSFEKRQ